jgi:hypothetical protein
MTYTLRRTWPELDRPDDYVVRRDGTDVGRLYRSTASNDQWHWTIYITASVHRAAGVPIEGCTAALDQAKQQFRAHGRDVPIASFRVTSRRSKQRRYSMTSSAVNSSFAGLA